MEEETKKDKKKFLKKWWFWTIISIIMIILLIGIILFFINKIPSKYYGTYTRYSYFGGTEFKITYKISPLKIKAISEYTEDGENKFEEEEIEYCKKGDDIIIKDNDEEAYLIIDNDCLYIETNKDISMSKEYGYFYWNEKSDEADLYKIENKSKQMIDLIEETMNSWARKLIYDTYDLNEESSKFYIFNSDKKSDKTDLNTYKINYNVAGGELSLYYDRKTQQLDRVFFSGEVFESTYSVSSSDNMDIYDIYDSKAMLLSLMYILGNKDNIELNQADEDIEKVKNYSKILKDLSYRTSVAEEYDKLFANKTTDEEINNRYTYTLKNDKYDIDYTSWISSTSYSFSGMIYFYINLI